MGTVSADDYFGGSTLLSLTGDTTLVWSRTQRFVFVQPNAGGHTLTLKAADSADIPFGYYIWVLKNASGSFTFTLADAEGDFSVTIGTGDGAYVSKYLNAGGLERFALDKRDGL
jgi:hypothetical protein